MNGPIEIFFSYAHEDEELMNDVRRQMIADERSGRITKWHDREIPPGANWQQQIDDRLNRASIILLFMSQYFIESKYCSLIEAKVALQRHKAGLVRVIPIILRPCRWNQTEFSKLQALPKDAKPITSWDDRDQVCLDVANGIMDVVDELLASRDSEKMEKAGSRNTVDNSTPSIFITNDPGFKKAERLMLSLLQEMSDDLRENPTTREFILLERGWVYNSGGPYLAYYFDDHEDLKGKIKILEHCGFVRDITYNKVPRFEFEEKFVDYLTGAA
jgi:hypothetical protein